MDLVVLCVKVNYLFFLSRFFRFIKDMVVFQSQWCYNDSFFEYEVLVLSVIYFYTEISRNLIYIVTVALVHNLIVEVVQILRSVDNLVLYLNDVYFRI